MRAKTIVPKIVIALVALLGCYIVFSARYFHGITPVGHGYHYFHSESGVVLGLDPQPDDALERIDRKAERDQRDLGEFQGLPQVGPKVDGYRVYDTVIVGHVRVRRESSPELQSRLQAQVSGR